MTMQLWNAFSNIWKKKKQTTGLILRSKNSKSAFLSTSMASKFPFVPILTTTAYHLTILKIVIFSTLLVYFFDSGSAWKESPQNLSRKVCFALSSYFKVYRIIHIAFLFPIIPPMCFYFIKQKKHYLHFNYKKKGLLQNFLKSGIIKRGFYEKVQNYKI